MKTLLLELLACLLVVSYAKPPNRNCPLTGCFSKGMSNDKDCINHAEQAKKCVEDGLASPDVCKCEESLVSSYAMMALFAGSSCQDPGCDTTEVQACRALIESQFRTINNPEEAISCIEELQEEHGACLAMGLGDSGTSKENKELLTDLLLRILRLMARGCDFQNPSATCARNNGLGPNSDPCKYEEITNYMKVCLKNEAKEQGEVCRGASELIEQLIEFQKIEIFEKLCGNHKKVQKALGVCEGQSKRNVYSMEARELWPFSVNI